MMKYRSFLIILLLVISTLLLLVEYVHADGPPTSCETAQALQEAGLYEEAQAQYIDLITANPQLACAHAGLASLLQEHVKLLYQQAYAYQQNDQPDLARGKYIEVLKTDPTFEKIPELLNRLDQLPPPAEDDEGSINKDEQIRRLIEYGFDEKAAETLQKFVEEDDYKVPPEFEYLLMGKTSLWRDVQKLEPLRRWGEKFLLIIIVGAVAFFMIYYLTPPGMWSQPQLNIEDFDGSGAGLETGTGLAAMVEEALLKLGASQRLHVIEGTGETFKIPTEITAKLPSSLQIVSSFVEWLFPSNEIKLLGRLQKSTDYGAGLTLTLVEKRSSKIVANQTIWLKDYDPKSSITPTEGAGPYYRLVDLAASWIMFKFADWQKHQLEFVGTRSWRSYALLQIGVYWRLQGNRERAAQMFTAALAVDPQNQGALFNLGVLNIELGAVAKKDQEQNTQNQKYKQAREQLTKIKTTTKDQMYYQSSYYLALLNIYDHKPPKDTEQKIHDLVTEITEILKNLPEKNQQLENYLKWLKPIVNIMGIRVQVDAGNVTTITQVKNKLEDEIDTLSYRARYNLACCYVRLSEKAKPESERSKALTEACKHLEFALALGGDIVRWAQVDPSLAGLRDDKRFKELVQRYGPSSDSSGQDESTLSLAKLRDKLKEWLSRKK